MAYTSGTAADIPALAAAFVTWVTGLASPWTINRNDAQGTGRRVQLSKGAQFMNLRFLSNEIPRNAGTAVSGVAGYPSDGYSAGADYFAQPGQPLDTSSQEIGALAPSSQTTITYHFFSGTGDDDLVLVLQRGTVFSYLSWGASLVKAGTWTGGRYYAGARRPQASDAVFQVTGGISSPPVPPFPHATTGVTINASAVRVAADGFAEEWRGSGRPTATPRTTRVIGGFVSDTDSGGNLTGAFGQDRGFSSPHYGFLFARLASALASNVLILPCPAVVERPSQRYSLLGTHPLIGVTYSRGVLADGTAITIGTDTWRVFGSFAVRVV